MSKHEYTKAHCDGCTRRTTNEETVYTKLCIIGHQWLFGERIPIRKFLCRSCRRPKNVIPIRGRFRAESGVRS